MIYVERLLSRDCVDLENGNEDACRVLASALNRVAYKEFSESLVEVDRVDSCLGGYRVRYHSDELNKDSLEVLVDYIEVLFNEYEKVA